MLSDAELLDMQTTVLGLLTDRCEIIRSTPGTPDSDTGEPTEIWNTLAADVPCSVVPHDVEVAENAVGRAVVVGASLWWVRLPANQPINEQDRILQTAPVSRTFEVMSVRGPKTREVSRIVVCNLLT